MTKPDYHIPVLLKECLEALDIKPNGIYVDATYGGGGHSAGILDLLQDGKLYAFDQDEDAMANKIEDDRLILIEQNFKHLKRMLKLNKVAQIDGLLADLGISSHQIDQPERGFSFRFDADLDMRMDQQASLSAKEVVNTYDAKALQEMFGNYGEVRNAKTLAEAIVKERNQYPIHTIQDFVDLIEPNIRGQRNKYLAQVFQAIRIEVNQEIQALKDLLEQSLELLVEGGRIVFLTYHSLEDRLVKNFIKAGNFEGVYEQDFYGKLAPPLQAINKKPILPSSEEISQNNRARSAKLRIAKKL